MLWALVGLAIGLQLGNLLERLRQGPGARSQPSDATLAGLKGEVDRLRLEWEDAQDKILHLYDRVRKRIPRDESPPPLAPGSQDALSTKDRLRQIARDRGLL